VGKVETVQYVRKPLFVEAVQVSVDNFMNVADWCQALIGQKGGVSGTETRPASGFEVDPSKHYIRIRVHNPQSKKQTMAFVGDWILYTEQGYKIYTDRAFTTNFDPVETSASADAPQTAVVE
jgi:hypothetical protein